MTSRSCALALAAVLVAIPACRRAPPAAPPPAAMAAEPEPVRPETALRPVPWPQVPPLIDGGEWASLDQALRRNREWLERQPPERRFVFGPRQVTAAEILAGCDLLLAWLAADPSPETLAARVAYSFEALASVGDGEGGMLVTGYYEPVIAGNLRRTAEYRVPVYGPPNDVVTVELGDFSPEYRGVRIRGRLRGRRLVPYPDRREIRRRGHLRGKEIAWARDPVDLFFVEVQGSGALRLPDGREIRIGYAGSNGRQYRSIGRLLIDRGLIAREKMSMQAIRQYLAAHPDEINEVLDHNPSVVFFRRLRGPPVGSLGVPVTPQRTVATDHRLFPPGALAFLVSEVPAVGPDGTTVAAEPLRRFVLNQDVGGAIRGPDRADFFWGRGEEAALRAGLMKQPGRLFFLAPKPRTPRPGEAPP